MNYASTKLYQVCFQMYYFFDTSKLKILFIDNGRLVEQRKKKLGGAVYAMFPSY